MTITLTTTDIGAMVCNRIVEANPTKQILAYKARSGWVATDAFDSDRPFVTLHPKGDGVEVAVRPRAGVFADSLGFTIIVHYPRDHDILSDAYVAKVAAAVDAKLAEIEETK